jgi:hypothetical protein
MYSQFPISSRTALIFGLFSRQLKDDMAEVWKTSATMASRDPPTVGYPPQAALQTFVDDWTRRWRIVLTRFKREHTCGTR